ncbi:MAG: PAS domain S-box protein, partial [Deltaproteobacteria bacterium]|nr:PAS domain S-box protein [Deltaproteobacteria bacterium]
MLRLNVVTDLYADPAARKTVLRKLSETGYVKDFPLELKRKDGERLTLLATITVIRDEKGDIVAHQGILHDITERIRVEKALADSEERLKATLDAAHIVAWEINVDGSHFEVGPVHELFGRPEGFRHPGLSDLLESIHPEDREGFESMMRSALRGEREYHTEFRVPQRDGTVRWIEAVGTLQRDAQGEPMRILGMAHDITKRKVAEEGLRKSENRIQSIINALPIGMHIYHMENDGRLILTGTNPAADKILGIDHSRLTGRTMEEAFPGLKATEVPTRYREAAEAGKAWYSEQVDYHEGAIRGAYEVYAFQTSPGNMAAVFEDITERKRMEAVLRESEDRFKRMVRNSNDIIGLVDENGTQISLSGPLEKILGYEPEELTGKDVFALIHPDDAENVKKTFREIISQPGVSSTVEYRMQNKNGKWVAVESVGSNYLQDPAVKAVVVNTRDIAERNRLQEQLQQAMKMEAVGRLAGGIAH